MKYIFILLLIFICKNTVKAQLFQESSPFTKADTLRGSLRPERTSFDMIKYNLNLSLDIQKQTIQGYNQISFKVLEKQQKMQLDLFQNMHIDSILYLGKKLKFSREFNAIFIDFTKPPKKRKIHNITVYYHGKPNIAKTPPWDGGFIYTQDKNNNPWIAVAVQGTGASLWYPNKDHLSDEPESVEMNISVPSHLVAVSNGKLVSVTDTDNDQKTYHWRVTYPINNYNVTLNIGDYVHFSDKFIDLNLEYYVLRDNLEKAKKHFKQVKKMMQCFYEKLGPYPFKKDDFKIVEAPYLGMEHQSAIAYGNQYQNGYMGTDLSNTGHGLLFDFIIIHESGHEWFGNSISVKDIADLWIHEGFTTYAESIYLECEYGKEIALSYIKGLQSRIRNDVSIIGQYGVNNEGSSDMYYKGSNIVNTLRSLVDDDIMWWKTLKDFHAQFQYSTITTKEAIAFFSKSLNKDLKAFFTQYLYYPNIPKLVLQWNNEKKELQYKWEVDIEDFDMPIILHIGDKSQWIYPNSKQWKYLKIDKNVPLYVDKSKFYVEVDL